MQVAANAKCLGDRPAAWHSIQVSASRSSGNAFLPSRRNIAAIVMPLAIRVGGRIAMAGRRRNHSREIEFAMSYGVLARRAGAAHKRNDGWKNMRNSSLSIA
ncbi:MAG TPA: hypothetical protein VMC81_01645 [Rhodocyclaceae bacterium]|nr:hypothetical protein [Rhodocyclaceae bacterium]